MTETFQISSAQAVAYEERFVPALFGEWAAPLVDIAAVGPGHRVLDVACGTGVVARVAAERTGDPGNVVGLDINPAMLEVAGGVRPDITWQQGDAQALPYGEGEFDRVLCQAGLFFFPDPPGALRELARVCRDGGVVAVQTFAAIEQQPGYGPFVDTVVRHAGEQARSLLGTYWSQGDLAALSRTLEGSGLRVQETRTRLGTARFGSVEDLIRIEVGGSPLADRVNEAQTALITEDVRTTLRGFVTAAGTLELPIRGHLVACTKE